MSRLNDERKFRQADKSRKPVPQKPEAVFVFRPTKEVKAVIKADWADLDKCAAVLESYIASGCRLSAGYASGSNAVWATMREAGEDWKTAVAVTAWHASLDMALAQLAYYLSEVQPEFPKGAFQLGFDEENNW